jgi:opacity protein-like surface antigen
MKKLCIAMLLILLPTIVLVAQDTVQATDTVQVSENGRTRKPFYISVRSNMLYDVALVPNVGAELYIGKNISVVGNWMYSWWKNDNIAWYWRIYGGDIGARYWFGKAAQKKPLTGHHAGLYAQMLTYDIELGARGYIGDRWSFGGGVEYGYSLPIARRLNIDFNLGIGYLGGEFKEYLPIDGHYVCQATKYRHWFGPTKAEVSLVWLLGSDNINERK